jgi:capsular polysaccharide biosynthesis protein
MENMSEKYAGGFLPFHPVVLLRDVAKRWLLILLAALIVGVAVYIHADESYAPVYRTTTTYVVTTHSSSATVYSNLTSASSLASVFSELLNSSIMRKAILEQI